MIPGPELRLVVGASTCLICERGRRSVPALVELRPGRVVCSECVTEAVQALVEHYGRTHAMVPLEPAPVPS